MTTLAIVITVARILAVLSSGLLAGILYGDRLGASAARPILSPSSFVQFQQVQHDRFKRVMPWLILASILCPAIWLATLQEGWQTPQFWLIAAAVAAMVAGAILTRTVNIPINHQLEKWSADAPPENMREIWARWERTHAIRTTLWLVAFALEVLVVGVFG